MRAYFLRNKTGEAIYRVVSENGTILVAEVVRAPGRMRGACVRLSAQAAAAMEYLPELPLALRPKA